MMRLGNKNKTSFILYYSRLSLSFDKIGCGSVIKIKQVLFCITLAFHYLCGRFALGEMLTFKL